MDFTSQAFVFVIVAVAVFVGTGALLPYLKRRAILDHPNERSSHETPTPKGGGIVLVPVIVLSWAGVGLYLDIAPFLIWGLGGAALLLAALSWIDDLKGLSPLVRLLSQIAAVTAVIALGPEQGLVFQGLLPPVIDAFATGLLWVWFINLFNFMDGIDGITGIESLIIGLGVALVGTGAPALLGLVIAAAALGFLKWNWHPAKIFMGDVGSVPIGFLLGWLLLDLAGQGHWAAALILPAYYLLDATVTLVRRGLKGEKVWQAHREHFYQQAVQRGLSHGTVSALVFLLGVMLIAFAYACQRGSPLKILITAFVLSLGFLFFLKGRAKS